MAKYLNNRIKSGRVAGSVFAVRYGEVIERAYNPYVSNPKTSAQVEARAKLKLVSQLSAVMAPYIAMPRVNAQTSRNLFVKKNYGSLTYVDNEASVNLLSVKLTDSVVSLPSMNVTRSGTNLLVSLISPVIGLDHVVYVAFVRQADGTIRAMDSKVVMGSAESSSTFQATLELTQNAYVYVYAYGVRLNTESAAIIFGNMEVPSAEQVAHLIVTRRLLDSDITLTETQAVVSTGE